MLNTIITKLYGFAKRQSPQIQRWAIGLGKRIAFILAFIAGYIVFITIAFILFWICINISYWFVFDFCGLLR